MDIYSRFCGSSYCSLVALKRDYENGTGVFEDNSAQEKKMKEHEAEIAALESSGCFAYEITAQNLDWHLENCRNIIKKQIARDAGTALVREKQAKKKGKKKK